MTPADYANDRVVVWEDNHLAATVFLQIRTQWRMSMAGPTGLDYAVLYRVIDDLGLPADEAKELFADVQVIEAAALDQMLENADAQRNKKRG